MTGASSRTSAVQAFVPIQRRLLTVGAAGAAVSIAGLFLDPTQFLQSYLMAYLWCLGATLGCLALGMVHQLSGGAWGFVIRQPIGAAARLLPLLTLLFLPILFGMGRLYIWTHADVVAADATLQHKRAYLNVPFFVIRASICFLAWNAISYFLNAWSLEQDRTGDPGVARRMQRLSAGGLLVYGVTITVAAFDWLMSLDPSWFSTIYGVLILGGQGLTALAFLIVVLRWLSLNPPLERVVGPAHFHDLGNLLLAFVMLWAYFAFSQFLIIWAGNLPLEAGWYVRRLGTSWRSVGVLLMLGHFAVPFVLLLSRTLKRERTMLSIVAVWLVVARLVDLFWLIAPEFHHDGLTVSWMDVLLPFALGALWLGGFVWQLGRRPILPLHDPEFGAAILRATPALGERSSSGAR